MRRGKPKYKKLSELLLIFLIIVPNLIHLDNFTRINNLASESMMLKLSNQSNKLKITQNYPVILFDNISFDSTRYGLKIGFFLIFKNINIS